MKIVFDSAALKLWEGVTGSRKLFSVREPYFAGERKSLMFVGASDLLLEAETPCEDQIEHIASTLNGFLERGGDTVESLEIEILRDRVILTRRSGEENLSYSFHAPEAKNER